MLEKPINVGVVVGEIDLIARSTSKSFGNIAARLIRYLERQPLEIRPDKPWVGTIIQNLRDRGIMVHRTATYPVWAPQEAPAR